jgi:hypothetical protein
LTANSVNMRLIGVKYCGGCNPIIDRSKLVREIEKVLPRDLSLTTDQSSQPWDIGILVCGCPSACVDKPEIRDVARRWIVVAGSAVDLDALPEGKMANAIVQKIRKL